MIVARPFRRLGLRRSTSGSAAVEFAFIMPFLLVLLLGAFEVSRYITTLRKVTLASNSVAEILSQNQSGTITVIDVLTAFDSIMITFPGVLADAHAKGIDWYNDIQATFSSVAFTPTKPGCTSNCIYTANVAWTWPWNSTGRVCGVPQTSVSDTSPPTLTALPQSSFGPGSMIVVDVAYVYTPTVATKLFSPMTIRKSFYIPPRRVPLVKLDPAAEGVLGLRRCPGY